MLKRVPGILLASAIGLAMVDVAQAGDFVPINQLMPAIRATLAKNYAHATLVSAERHTELNAYVYFTITLRDGKTTSEIKINENGDVVPPAR